MDQRIGSSNEPLKGAPVEGAGFDPAFIPGLTAQEPKDEAEPTPAEEPGREPAPEPTDAKEDSPEATEETSEDTSEENSGDAADGPVFEAADRRARITADGRGVRLRLDEEDCEFRWDEIAAVETESPRFGKRYTVTVHTPDRRWFPIEIEAPARSRFKEWDEQLDAVLDAYFEEA
ncbi:hypothetical protein [Streptomyces sp. NPDC047028]|uniref:hypothetical protein n=1 Tax=Streptomyces sp. NPDC047028 TaxID=3155793 RepID=UPI0033F91826